MAFIEYTFQSTFNMATIFLNHQTNKRKTKTVIMRLASAETIPKSQVRQTLKKIFIVGQQGEPFKLHFSSL